MYIIGIDEAGRGSLAGPVVVAAVLTPRNFYPKRTALPKLKDSKKLSSIQRQVWFKYLKSHPKVFYATARVYPRKIEKLNIANCANIAAAKAFWTLISKLDIKNLESSPVILDGSLYLGSKGKQPNFAKTIIRGDEKFISIKLASIVAKVTRDNYMISLHRKYPLYQFDRHKGYGTALHRNCINRFGPAQTHRLTYLKNYRKLA